MVIVSVIFALIFLGGSQALSKSPPRDNNYCAEFTSVGDAIVGAGLVVGGPRGIFSSPRGYLFILNLNTTNYVDWDNFAGEKGGLLDINFNRRSGMWRFYYAWPEGEIDYSLEGECTFEYNKKTGLFEFVSQGEYYIRNWGSDDPPVPSEIVWAGELSFTIDGIPLNQCDDYDCACDD